jgi:UDP-N-acetylglucosamine acyltransferase
VIDVHPSAQISERARLADGVRVGPLCIVGDDVVLGPGTQLVAACTVLGPTHMGAHNVVFPYAVIGAEPQDRSHEGQSTSLSIGDHNVFREHVTVHRGTVKDRGETRIGSHCLLMVGTHVAHDAVLGDGITLANATLLGGHVVLGDRVTTGGHAAIAPFVRVGQSAFVAAGAMVEADVPPFVIVAGDRARVRALNRVGLVRSGVPEPSRRALRRAFRVLFRDAGPLRESMRALDGETAQDPYVQTLLGFLSASLAERPA